MVVVAASPLWLGAMQLIPVPTSWWAALAGRQGYLEAMQAAGLEVPSSLPLSLNPGATWASVWSALPLSAAFLGACCLRKEQVDRLLMVLLLAGVVQVLLAVAQFATGRQSVLYFGVLGQQFIGSFANRNHLADFLAMLVPVWFYAWLWLQRRADAGDERQRAGLRGRFMRAPLLLIVGFSFVVMVLSTQSRGGILAMMAVLVLSCALYFYSLRRRLKRWQLWALLALLVGFVALVLGAVDLKGIASRIEQGRLQMDAQVRQTLAGATWDAAQALWPWGSGMGTFESVFPRFQPALSPHYVNHAHNDYPQLVMELGAPGLVIVALLLVLVARQAWLLLGALRAGGRLSLDLGVRCFAGFAVLALLLHSWVEFNMHIPALTITAAFLLGVYLRPLQPQ